MSDNVSQIDYEAVRKSANGFQTAHQTLTVVNITLEAAMMLLRTTAFIGLVGGFAVERYLANIQPKVQRLAEKCMEISEDLEQTVLIHQSKDGDSEGHFQS
jgi:hypothetical protein